MSKGKSRLVELYVLYHYFGIYKGFPKSSGLLD